MTRHDPRLMNAIGILRRLAKFANHTRQCSYWKHGHQSDYDNPAFCDCGLAKILGEAVAAESAEVSE